MKDKDIIKLDLLTLGKLEVHSSIPIFMANAIGKTYIDCTENPLESLRINSQIKNLNKILTALNLDKKDVDWSKVSKIDLLEILKGAQNVEEDSDPELFLIWKKLIEDYLDKDSREKSNILFASRILSKMNCRTVFFLDLLFKSDNYLNEEKLIDFTILDIEFELDNLGSLDLAFYRAPEGGQIMGMSQYKSPSKVINLRHKQALRYSVTLTAQAMIFCKTIGIEDIKFLN